MKKGETKNMAVIAHRGAGKTTLSEAILFNAGAIDRLGRVDEGTSTLDFEPEEVKKRVTISAGLHDYEWDKFRVNILDTPGYSAFLTDTRGCLRVAGGSVLILSAISGIKAETEKLWGWAGEFGAPGIGFINKMDRERADFETPLNDIEKSLGIKGIPIQVPIGREDAFKGVVNLVDMSGYIYKDDGSGKFEAGDIPAEAQEAADKYREALIEAVAELDDQLLEKYLEGGELTTEEIENGIKEAVATKAFLPLLCGSALGNIGIQPLMDAINKYCPFPADLGTAKGTDTKTGEEAERSPDPEAPFSGLVFKTLLDPFAGKLSVFRVYSGTLNSDTGVLNATKGSKERIGQLLLIEGKKQKPVTAVSVGDVAAVAKLKDTGTGDTLCSDSAPITYEGFTPVPSALSFAIEPKTKADEDKVNPAISKLMEEDPSLHFERDEQTNEFVLSGVGQDHLEITIEKLKRKFGVEVSLKTPKVPYKETIRGRVEVQGKYKKQSGGRGQFGDTWIKLEPLSRGGGFEFVNKIVGGAIPRQYIPAVEKGIKEAMQEGVVAGYNVVDVKATLYDGSFHAVDSSEMAFKIAGSMGFKKGVLDAKPVLLEPIMQMEIDAPDANTGDVMGDLNSKRGKVQGMDPKGSSQIIRAQVPMAEILTYATTLKSITGGQGSFAMEFSHYEEVPAHLAQKIIEGAKRDKEEEK